MFSSLFFLPSAFHFVLTFLSLSLSLSSFLSLMVFTPKLPDISISILVPNSSCLLSDLHAKQIWTFPALSFLPFPPSLSLSVWHSFLLSYLSLFSSSIFSSLCLVILCFFSYFFNCFHVFHSLSLFFHDTYFFLLSYKFFLSSRFSYSSLSLSLSLTRFPNSSLSLVPLPSLHLPIYHLHFFLSSHYLSSLSSCTVYFIFTSFNFFFLSSPSLSAILFPFFFLFSSLPFPLSLSFLHSSSLSLSFIPLLSLFPSFLFSLSFLHSSSLSLSFIHLLSLFPSFIFSLSFLHSSSIFLIHRLSFSLSFIPLVFLSPSFHLSFSLLHSTCLSLAFIPLVFLSPSFHFSLYSFLFFSSFPFSLHSPSLSLLHSLHPLSLLSLSLCTLFLSSPFPLCILSLHSSSHFLSLNSIFSLSILHSPSLFLFPFYLPLCSSRPFSLSLSLSSLPLTLPSYHSDL
ncbi:unnamed protein product [Acanthosepion pharaonis]|uniref:Uncharacterized protein n=1 Tax=Acanthosepion pharaonis TaxID=158019 RepID=A0A812AJG5_ACAPH|nr:unnamed protein product [Sepia pharaonis]